jgi:hypothetical protein
MQQPHRQINRDDSDTEDELSLNSAAEDDSRDTVPVESKRGDALESSSQNINPSTIGAALKSGISSLQASRKKQKSQNKLSWRERLGYSRKDASNSDAGVSDSHTSASDDDDYSDWSGLGGENEHANSVVHEDTAHRDSSEDDDEIPPQDTDQVEAANISQTDGDGGEDVHQRASQFKSWAREQSGFGSSLSNISSLPALPSPQSDPKPTLSRPVDGPESLSNGSKPVPVFAPSLARC